MRYPRATQRSFGSTGFNGELMTGRLGCSCLTHLVCGIDLFSAVFGRCFCIRNPARVASEGFHQSLEVPVWCWEEAGFWLVFHVCVFLHVLV
jgi:hypothetical protein